MLNYKGLRGTRERYIVSDRQVDEQIDALLDYHRQIIPVTDRPSQPDDELVLDYAGFSEGVQFEGGTAERQTLTLGSGAFIPGFEDQLVGHHVGDQVDVRVTFPTEYHAPALAGKEAVFKCTIHEIRVRRKYAPDDAFAKAVGGFDSFEKLREAVRRSLQSHADQRADEDLKASLLDAAMVDYECEITDEQLEIAVTAELNTLEAQLQRQGLTLDAYCQFTGKTREQLRLDCLPDARKAVRRQSAIAEIADAEHIEADEASVAAAIQEICRQNGLTVDQLTQYMDEAAQAAVIRNVITEKVLNRIVELADIETVEKRA